jgi:hypothetical protein
MTFGLTRTDATPLSVISASLGMRQAMISTARLRQAASSHQVTRAMPPSAGGS